MILNRKSTTILLFFLLLSSGIFGTTISKSESKDFFLSRIDSCSNNLIDLNNENILGWVWTAEKLSLHQPLISLFEDKGMDAYANHVLMNKAIASSKMDSAYYFYKEAEQLHQKERMDDKRILAVRELQFHFILACVSTEHLHLGIHVLENNLEFNRSHQIISESETYMELAMLYSLLNKPEEAIRVAQFAYNSNINILNKKNSLLPRMAILEVLADSYLLLKDYPKSIMYADSLLKVYTDTPQFDVLDDNYRYYWAAIFSGSANKSICYSYMGDYKQAKLMLEESSKAMGKIKQLIFSERAENELLANYNFSYLVYHYQKGEYDQAKKYLEEIKKHVKIPRASPEYADYPKWEAMILQKTGQYKQANELLNKMMQASDSLNRINSSKEVASMWAIFEVDRAQLEKEQSEQRLYIIAISAFIIICLGIIVIVYYKRTNRKLKEKNKVLFESLKKHRSDNSSNDTLSPSRDNPENITKSSRLFYQQIVGYLKETKSFVETDITRESLAKELGTNRQYLIETIRENCGMSFNEFINDLRLDYVQEQLLNEDNVMIKEIYLDSGFNSRSTFTRLFRAKYGMTPTEFRECAVEDKKSRRDMSVA